VRTRLTARFVVGYDGGDHVVYRDGEVVYEDDRVVFVGHGYAGPVDATIDAGDALAGPGFVDLDALADVDHAVLDTFQPPDLARGLAWSEDYFHTRRHEVFTPQETRDLRRYALVQLLLNGITTAMPIAAETYRAWAETGEELAGVAETAGQLGLRMYLGPSYRSGINVVRADGTPAVLWDEPLGEEGLQQAVEFVRRFDGAYAGRIRGCLLPCRIETVTLDLLRATRRYADELGCPVRLHAAQGLQELRFLREWYGQRPIPLLASLGFLGPHTSIPHVLYVRGQPDVGDDGPDDVAILAETGTTVIHCPLTSVRHGHALDTFDRYRQAGVNLAMGTDTFPPDMIRVLDYGSNVARLMARSGAAGAAADLYRAATLGGARALGRDDLGRLAPGAKADLVVVDLSRLRCGPIDDPIRTLLYNTGGADVRTVVVDGHTVVRDGAVLGVDADALRARGQALFEQLKRSYSERDFRRREASVLFPSSFPLVERPAP
jgi:cytosine/adenosine deaminase-related metal-dependent hydrolase